MNNKIANEMKVKATEIKNIKIEHGIVYFTINHTDYFGALTKTNKIKKNTISVW